MYMYTAPANARVRGEFLCLDTVYAPRRQRARADVLSDRGAGDAGHQLRDTLGCDFIRDVRARAIEIFCIKLKHELKSSWARTANERLHVLPSPGSPSSLPPLVYCPGLPNVTVIGLCLDFRAAYGDAKHVTGRHPGPPVMELRS